MKAHASTKKKTRAKTVAAKTTSLATKAGGLPGRLRAARKIVTTLGSNAVGYVKRHPKGTIASVLLVGAAVRKLARRA